MTTPKFTRGIFQNVTLLGDACRPSGVTLAFTERMGGVSEGPYASLNLDDYYGDDAVLVAENRRRVMDALGMVSCASSLVTPRQVHGTTIVCIEDGGAAELETVRKACDEGADAIVCTVQDVPVLLRAADCALVVLVVEGGFAVAHSGWRGTLARISQLALEALCARTGAEPSSALAYVGPHIAQDDYVVSSELAQTFVDEFGPSVVREGCKLSLAKAISITLAQAGVPADQTVFCATSTATNTDRFYSYRASGGQCGRHGVVACRFTGTPRDIWQCETIGEEQA